MSLLQFMHDVPFFVTAIVVVALACLYSVGLMLLTRRHYGVEWLSLNNEVAGFKFAVVGVFYAVLLAFVVIAVWEDFKDTETAVRTEARAAVDLHQVTYALPEENRSEIRRRLTDYIEGVIEHEWPAMSRGEPSERVGRALDHLEHAVFDVEPRTQRELAIYQEALRLLALITDNRTERVDDVAGSVQRILWAVLIIGGLITLGYPAFFASSSLGAQTLMTAALAALVVLALLLVLAFDYPFTGEMAISAAPFEEALRQMAGSGPKP
jgi:hypothetical protein